MIKEFYAEEVRYENGTKYIVIQDENKIPSLRQFRYWYNKEFGIEQKIISREGDKKFERFSVIRKASLFMERAYGYRMEYKN